MVSLTNKARYDILQVEKNKLEIKISISRRIKR